MNFPDSSQVVAPTPTATDMSARPHRDGLSALRDLLGVARTDEEVTRLERRLEDRVVRAQDIAEVLPESVRAANQSGRLAPALDGAVANTLKDLVRRDPEMLGEALFPVIGPAIRRAIAEAMKSLVQGLNTAMEQKLSARGMRWRLESWRTGVPFREVVLKHTLEYRVRQVFLIDRRSGLLMAHAGDEDALAVDEDAVSAMLIAIQDFVRDSIGDDESEGLSSAELDDETLWVVTGPRAQLAAVIDGFPPRELRTYLSERVENVHGAFDHWLVAFPDGGDVPGGLPLVLDECLRSATKPGEQPGSPAKAVVVLALAAIAVAALAGWWWREDQQRRDVLDTVAERIEAAPGRVLIGRAKSDDRTIFYGLADPLADDEAGLLAGLEFDEVPPAFRWEPYRSEENAIALRRVRSKLDPPDDVTITAQGDRITVAGVADEEWFERAQAYARVYDGGWRLDLDALKRAAPPPAPAPRPGPTLEQLIAQVERGRVTFARDVEVTEAGARAVVEVAEALTKVQASAAEQGATLAITVVGQTDTVGPDQVNANLRAARAQWLADELRRAGALRGPFDVRTSVPDAGPEGRLARVEVQALDGADE